MLCYLPDMKLTVTSFIKYRMLNRSLAVPAKLRLSILISDLYLAHQRTATDCQLQRAASFTVNQSSRISASKQLS
jgi:hypothetical protein